jgi:hypothetical protein
VGESSAAGESVSEELVRLVSSPSILGTYEWVRKAFQTAPVVGSAVTGSSSTTTREPGIGMGVAAQVSRHLVGPIQTIPAVMAGNHSDSGELGVMPASQFKFSSSIGDVSSGLAGAEQTENILLEVQGLTQKALAELVENHGDSSEIRAAPASQFKSPGPIDDVSNGLTGAKLTEDEILKMQGGGFMVEVIHSGVKEQRLVPSVSGTSLLENGALRGPVEGRGIGDGILAIPQQAFSAGLEMVPFVEEEPIPLDWSHASEAGDGSGSQATGKEEEVIFAFSQIVGISCDGQFDRLREAFALILAGKAYKPGKNSVGGGKAGKKGMCELDNLHSSINYDGGSGSVSRSRGKGRGNRICL